MGEPKGEVADDIRFSICIPTYNRADFLDYLLTDLAKCKFGFPIEIVISDNASTDATEAVARSHMGKGLPITYFRQETNRGWPSNIASVYHRARGRYFMYLADDDLLIPDAVAATLKFMDDHPEVLAAYAPWELFDDVKKAGQGLFYRVDQDVIFSKGQDAQLLKYVVERHIFPEIVIYRAAAARSLILQGFFSFQHFVDFGRIYARGAIAFLAKPFYRSVTDSHLRRAGEQAGIEHVMTQWDSYRGGLESFVYRCLKTAGVSTWPDDEKAIRSAIEGFVDIRMSVAQRLWLARKDFVRAYEILCRRRFFNPEAVGQEAAKLNNLQQLVVFQTLAYLANGIVDVRRVLLGDIDTLQDVEGMLRHCGLEERVGVALAPDVPAPDDLQCGLVLIQQETNRQKFLDQGYLPGLIVSQDDLAAML